MTVATKIRQDDIVSREAEAGVLGSLILVAKNEPARVGDVVGVLQIEDFHLPEHQTIYAAMCDIYLSTSALDPVVLRERLKRGNELDEVGGVDEYIVSLAHSVVSEANLDYYVEIIKRKANNRRLIQAAESIHQLAIGPEQPDDKIEGIQEIALALTPLERKQQVHNVAECAQESLEEVFKNKSGLKTGFEAMDWHLGGLHPGDLIVVAARPSMGKTSFATDVTLSMARAGYSVIIYSLEMTKQQLIERMIASIARVDLHNVRQKRYTPEEANEMASAVGILETYKLFIMDCSTLTPETLRASLKTVQHRYGVDCVMVDYLQLMEIGRRGETRQQEVTAISRGLKAAAKSEALPVIVLSQLNREVEHRQNHKPLLSDLRESGSIEQDADVVILLHRPDWYHKGEPESKYTPTGNGVFQVAKSRNGPTGEVELQFTERYASFSNISKATD
jgi:replicative DNA helicase